MKIKISVIIPVYNVQNYIENTLKSILSQSLYETEIIIINDGSIDHSEKVIKNLIGMYTDLPIRYISKKNEGVSIARNLGIDIAIGEYLYFLDGDDQVSDNLIEHLNEIVEIDIADVVFWDYRMISDNMNNIKEYSMKQYNKLSSGEELLWEIVNKRASICIGSAIYRRSLIIENHLKFTPGCKSGEDLEFIFKTLSHAKNVQYMKNVTTYYVQRENSATRKYDIKRFDSIIALERGGEYINNIDTSFSKISHCIRNDYLVNNYMGTYRLCMKELTYKHSVNVFKANLTVKNDIKRHYQSLEKVMRHRFNNNRYRSLATNVKVTLFRISPILYYYIANIWLSL